VAVLARGQAGLDGAAADVRQAGGKCLALPVDVADSAAVDAAADRIEAELGPIAVWVNVAFAGSLAFFWDTSPEEFRRMTEVTYYGQVNGMRTALRLMRPRDRGSIVNVSSAMAYRSIPLQSTYCGAKHAVKGVSESLIARTARHRQQGERGPGHPARREHHPVQLEPEQDAQASHTRAAHRAARDLLPRHPVQRRAPAPQHMGGHLHRLHRARQPGRAGTRRLVPGQDRRQVPADRPRRSPLGIQRLRAQDAEHDREARGAFGDKAAAHDPVSFLARHRRAALAGGAAALLAGSALLWRARP
jgi:NAD(P)-dependent dehydrogenase (short-subunit alcohol dehydrogenase family)